MAHVDSGSRARGRTFSKATSAMLARYCHRLTRRTIVRIPQQGARLADDRRDLATGRLHAEEIATGYLAELAQTKPEDLAISAVSIIGPPRQGL